MNRLAASLIALVALSGAMWLLGASHVQHKWDLERERLRTIAEQAVKQGKAALQAVEQQHRKDIEHAKSQAGRTAIAAWLKSHGLLSDGSQVPGSGSGQNASSCVTDATGGERGTGGGIEGFALRCGQDALTVEAWQDLCRANPATCEIVNVPPGD